MDELRITLVGLEYSRHQELVNDEHLFSGYLTQYEGENVALRTSFGPVRFAAMMTELSRSLRTALPDAAVTLLRTERRGARPLVLDEELRKLLRDDPVRAIRAMTVDVGSASKGSRPVPSVFNAAAETFGERVYIRLRNGVFEDPCTGTNRSIAYSPKDGGWFIRGERDSVSSWLPVRLPELDGVDIDVSAGMEAVGAELAKCRWATALVEDILKQNFNKYFLPRRWNTSGQWITRTELRTLLDAYKQREECES